MAEKISHKIIRNTVYNSIGRFWGILIGFFLTPFIIHRIGLERYGILAISGTITGYFGLLDLGIGSSFGRFIAAFHTSREPAKIGEVVGIGLVFYTIVGTIVTVVACVLLNPLIEFFKIPHALHDEAFIVFMAGILLFVVSGIGSVFVAVQVGLQRMDLMNKIAMAMSVVSIAGTVFVLGRGFGLLGLMANNALILMLGVLINVAVACMLVPDAMTKGIVFSKAMFRQLFSFGWRMQIARISGLVVTQIDKLLIVSFLSVGLVTYYQLGSAIVLSVAAFAGLLTSSLMPAFTELDIRQGRAQLVAAYMRSTKYLAFIIVPLFVFLIFSASRIMTVWMSQPCAQAAFVIRVLAAGWMINTIAQVATSMCVAINKPQFMARSSLIIVVLNLIGSTLLIKLFGFSGAAWGTMIAITTGTVYFTIELHRTLGISLKDFAAVTVPYVLTSCVATGVTMAAGMANPLTAMGMDRGWQAATLFVQGSIFTASYLTGVFVFKFFGKSDIVYLKQTIFPATAALPERQGSHP